MKVTKLEIQGDTCEVENLRVQGAICYFTYKGCHYQFERIAQYGEGLRLRNHESQSSFRVKMNEGGKNIHGAHGKLMIKDFKKARDITPTITSPNIKADYPGMTLDIFIKVGDHVEIGDSLVKIESMKLERHILAPFKGEVKSIDIKVGDVLRSGQTLIVLEEVKE